MKLKLKGALLTVFLGLLTIIFISIIYYGLYREKQKRELSDTLNTITLNADIRLNEEFESRELFALAIAGQYYLADFLEESNETYEALSEWERQTRIDSLNKAWMNGEAPDLMESVIQNRVSDQLRGYENIVPDEIGEIFLTNKFGTVAAATIPTTTFAQAFKPWWKEAYGKNPGQIFIDDRGFDLSAGEYVLGILVPIHLAGEVIGILKVNFNSDALLGRLVEVNHGIREKLMIARSGGAIVKELGKGSLSTSLPESIVSLIEQEPDGYSGYDEVTEAFYSIRKFNKENCLALGGDPGTVDNSAGNAGENWYIVARVDEKDAYGGFIETLGESLILAVIGVLALSVFAYFFGRMMVRPLDTVLALLDRVGDADFSERLEGNRTDELGSLFNHINSMVDKLARTTTSKKRLEDEMALRKENQQRYETLFTTISEGFALHEIIVDANGLPIDYRFLDINPAFEAQTGLKADALIGKRVLEVMPDTEEYWIREFGEVALRGVTKTFQNYSAVLGKHYQVSAYSPSHGLFAVTMFDVTPLKELELALQKEKEFFQVTLKSIGDAVLATDQKGDIIFINPVAEKMTGWTTNESIGRPLMEVLNIVDETTKVPRENPAVSVIESGNIIELANHTVLLTKEGDEVVIEDSAAPIKNKDGEIIGVIIVFRDSTEKIKIRNRLHSTQKLESLGVLAGGIAHDFNNYLSGIFGYMEITMKNLQSQGDDKNYGYLLKAATVSEKARSLTQQLLTFSKGGIQKMESSDIGRLLKDCVGFALSGSNIIPKVNIQEGLWACKCDKNQIAQCFDNLIINAKQAMPKGGRLEVTAENTAAVPDYLPGDKRYVRIIIKDHGMGIPAKNIDNIFDPFFTTKEQGHGLGLATVHSIIKNHDGGIEVKSVENESTAFIIHLPAEEVQAPMLTENLELQHKGKGRILVLDDQPYILDITMQMLEMMGYEAITVENGFSAIEAVANDMNDGGQIKACLLDLTLPGEFNGIQTAEQIRKMNGKLILIAASGYSDSQVMSSPEKYGFNGTLKKPFNFEELSEILKKFVDQ